MTLFRYEFLIPPDNKVGILVGLELFFDTDEILSLGWTFERYLNLPDISMANTKSYFTQKGNRKFGKAICRIKKAALEKGITVVCEKIDMSSIHDIVYTDKYQVVSKMQI